MRRVCASSFPLLALVLLLAGCATRPINPPITQADPSKGYRFETRQVYAKDKENLVIHELGMPTPLDKARRIIVFVVNSLSSPPTNWDSSESPPGSVDVLIKAAGTPIDQYSFESVELLKDTAAQWRAARLVRNSAAMVTNKDPAVAAVLRVPDAEIYAIDVSFAALKDKAEFDYLNQLPTSFVLPPEAVDRLRAAATTIILAPPEFQRLLNDAGAKLVEDPPTAGGSAAAH